MKFCILAAGIGSRNNVLHGLHKGLLPIQNIPMISHVISKLESKQEIIVAVGHLSDQIISYLKFVHPERNIKFINIDHFSGKGSGPGYSLLQCKEELQCPFVFGTIDTFFDEEVKFDVKNNWIGVATIPSNHSKNYCMVKGEKKLESLYYGIGNTVYNGFAGIYDYKKFWNALETSSLVNNEHQVTSAIDELKNVELKNFKNFHDTGIEEKYVNLRKKIGKEIVFAKNDEAIFLDNKKVVKYFSDETKCKNRIKRVSTLQKLIPSITKLTPNMFGYDFIDGKLLSEINDEAIFLALLEEFYSFSIHPDTTEQKSFSANCLKMYKTKTYDRVKPFQNSLIDNIKIINEIQVDKISKILEKINWEHIVNTALPSYFHGDLQPENIIIGKNNKITLIDWRESFGDDTDIGDLYYDLGKLYHGLLINGKMVKDKKFSLQIENTKATLSYSTKDNLMKFKKILEIFCKKHNLDYDKVQLLGALQYLNIAEFYMNTEPKYSKFIFLLGKLLMTEIIGKND